MAKGARVHSSCYRENDNEWGWGCLLDLSETKIEVEAIAQKLDKSIRIRCFYLWNSKEVQFSLLELEWNYLSIFFLHEKIVILSS